MAIIKVGDFGDNTLVGGKASSTSSTATASRATAALRAETTTSPAVRTPPTIFSAMPVRSGVVPAPAGTTPSRAARMLPTPSTEMPSRWLARLLAATTL